MHSSITKLKYMLGCIAISLLLIHPINSYASEPIDTQTLSGTFEDGIYDTVGEEHRLLYTSDSIVEYQHIDEVDWKNMSDEELHSTLLHNEDEDIGMFLLGLSDDDFYEIIERDTVLKYPVYTFTDTDETYIDEYGEEVPVQIQEVLYEQYWEKAVRSCMSLFAWTDDGYYQGNASGYFYIEIKRGSDQIEYFKVTINSITSGNGKLGTDKYEISGLDGEFTVSSVYKEYKTSPYTWAGVVVNGSYTQYAHYTPSWDSSGGGLGRCDPWNNDYTKWSLNTKHVSSDTTDTDVRIQCNSGNWGGLSGYSGHATGTIYLKRFKDKLIIDANGGSCSTATTSKTCTSTTTVADPTREGYVFTGWTLTKGSGSSGSWNSSTKTYTHCNSGVTWNTSTDVYDGQESSSTLKAGWSACSYTIAFNANGGSGSMSNITGVKYGESKTLTANAFTRTGYTFKGWATSASGSKKYDDKASVKNLTETNGATVTLYAVWQINEYKLTVKPNGGTWNSQTTDQEVKQNYLTTYTVADATRTGYQFGGWTKSGTGTWTADTKTWKFGAGNGTLTANWTANTYTVKYNKNKPSNASSSVSGTMENSSHTYDTEKALTANAYSLVGHTFTGWNKKADGSGTAYADKEKVKNLTSTNDGTVNLYAQWKAHTYTVTYNKNKPSTASSSVSGTMSNSSYTYDVASTLRTNTYKLTGWVFTGWNTKADGSGTSYEDGAAVSNWTTTDGGSITLYAQWEAINYTVAYNKNKPSTASSSVTGTISNSSHTYDVAAKLNKNNYSLVGWTFTGWNTKADGSGTSYSDEQLVSNLTTTADGKVTLYAQWEANKFTVTYNKNKPSTASSTVSGTMNSSSYTYDVDSVLRTNTYTLTGWIFQGWNTKADGSGTAYADKANVTNMTSEDGKTITLYAQWIPITYTLKYNSNSTRYTEAEITGSGSSTTLTYDVDYIVEKFAGNPNNFSCNTEHYKFDHWDSKSDDTGTDYSEGQKVVNLTTTNNATLTMYAQYKIQYKVYHYLQDDDGTYPTTPDYTDINFDFAGEIVGSSYIKTIAGHFAPYANSTSTPANGISSKNITINLDYTKNEIHYFYPKKDFNIYVDPNSGTWRGSKDVTTVNLLVGNSETIELPENPYSGTLRFYFDSSLDGEDTLVGERPVNKIFDGWTHTGGGEFTNSKTGNSKLAYSQNTTTKQAVNSGDAYLTANYIIGYYQIKASDVPANREHYKFLGWNIDPTVYPNPDIYDGDDAIYDPVVDAKYQANNSAKVTDYVVGDKIYILEDSTGKTYIYENNVNTWVEAKLYEVWRVDFELDTVLTRVLKPDNSEDPGFRAGEAGEIFIDTIGFVDEIDIEFPPVLNSLDKSLSEHRDITPLLTDSHRKNFNIPLYAPSGAYKIKIIVHSKSYQDPLESEHIVYVRKDGEGGGSWWPDPDVNSIVMDFKTRLR